MTVSEIGTCGYDGMPDFGARYYGSALGRFTSPDEPLLDQAPDDPQSWNIYAYGRNNPLRFTDPTGTTTCDSNGNNCHDSTSVSANAPGISPIDALLLKGLLNSLQWGIQTQHSLQSAATWLSQPRNGTCLAASTAVGASSGALAGIAGGPAVLLTEPTAMFAGGVAGWAGGMISCMSSSGTGGSTNENGGGTNRSTAGNMQKQVERDQAPKFVDRVDRARFPFEEDQVHFKDGHALNFDGTWKHGGRALTNTEADWLVKNGWSLPK